MKTLKAGSAALLGACALLSLLATGARADHAMVAGRTGLPTVREGQEKIWIENGIVELQPNGDDLNVTQKLDLRYPDSPLETKSLVAKFAVREDYYRAKDKDTPTVKEVEAKGFSDFNVMVDGEMVASSTEPWKINDKKDTATRWRVWTVSFEPGQLRHVVITSRAPLGQKGERKTVEFVSKDVGHWRQAPDNLVIRYVPADGSGVKTVGVEPKPKEGDDQQIEWKYMKASPKRDVYVILPPTRIRSDG
jgi:hypothetical protein